MDQEKTKNTLSRRQVLGGTAAALGSVAAIPYASAADQTLQIYHQMCLNGRPILAPVLTLIPMVCRLNMSRT